MCGEEGGGAQIREEGEGGEKDDTENNTERQNN